MNVLQLHINYVWVMHFTKYDIRENPTATIILVLKFLPLMLNIIQIRANCKEVTFIYMAKPVLYLKFKHILRTTMMMTLFELIISSLAQRFIKFNGESPPPPNICCLMLSPM